MRQQPTADEGYRFADPLCSALPRQVYTVGSWIPRAVLQFSIADAPKNWVPYCCSLLLLLHRLYKPVLQRIFFTSLSSKSNGGTGIYIQEREKSPKCYKSSQNHPYINQNVPFQTGVILFKICPSISRLYEDKIPISSQGWLSASRKFIMQPVQS